MPASSDIYSQIRQPEQYNPLQALAQAMQVKGLQNQGEMAQYTMKKAQRDDEDSNALRASLAGGTDPYQALLKQGRVKEANDYQKGQADIGKTKSETSKADVEIEHKTIGLYRDASQAITDPMSAQEFVKTMHTDPRLKNSAIARVPLDQALAQIPQDPAQLGAWKQQFALGAAKFIEANKPTFQTRNTGGTTDTLQLPGLGGAATVVNSIKNTQSPDSVASNATQRRGQDLLDARSKDANANAAVDGGTNQALLNKQNGKPPAGFRWKPDGGLESIPGGPADQKAQNTEAGKGTVDSVVATLRNSYDSLNKGGGITSTQEGTMSNIGRTVSKSGLGQFVGGAVGSVNQKERDAIAQTRPLLLQAIMKATGMSAKQMDSNAELKLYLATATDPTLSLQANREALDRIESLYGSGSGKVAPTNPSTPSQSAPAMPAGFKVIR